MKKSLLAASFLFALLLTPAAALWADDAAPAAPASDSAAEKEPYSERIGLKLGRGLENLIVGWMEIPHQIQKTHGEKGVLQASTAGVGKGLVYTVRRMGVGTYEVVTFPYAQEPILETMESWN